MAKYRNSLPQLGGNLFLTDGGIETTLIFHDGLELPDFAAFDLFNRPEGIAALRKYFRTYASLAKRFGTGLILESATWRANPDWATRLGYTDQKLSDVNRSSIHLLEEIRNEFEDSKTPIVISGCLGPRGDGYNPVHVMSPVDAEAYHQKQVETFADTAADMVTAITMNYVQEAIGIAQAAKRVGMPVAISFTVETDGKLPTGDTLKEAIERVDLVTSKFPSYYMINCAHPSHFERVLPTDALWVQRIRGLRANASKMSHSQLNEAAELDIGNPSELGTEYASLKKKRLLNLNVVGGCCGTDDRHVEAIARACVGLF